MCPKSLSLALPVTRVSNGWTAEWRVVEKRRPATSMSPGDKYRLYYHKGKLFKTRKMVDQFMQVGGM
jgi:hypothetical protein